MHDTVIAAMGKPPALPERLPKFDFYGRLDKETAYWENDCGLPPHLNPLRGEEVIPRAGFADGIIQLSTPGASGFPSPRGLSVTLKFGLKTPGQNVGNRPPRGTMERVGSRQSGAEDTALQTLARKTRRPLGRASVWSARVFTAAFPTWPTPAARANQMV